MAVSIGWNYQEKKVKPFDGKPNSCKEFSDSSE